jgi:hypothetical protein
MQNRDAFRVAFVEPDETDMAYVHRDLRESHESHIERWTILLIVITILAIIVLAGMGAF